MKWETLKDFQTDIPLHHWFLDMTPNLSSWKHSGTTTNNSLYELWTISQAKNSVKQHHIQNYFMPTYWQPAQLQSSH